VRSWNIVVVDESAAGNNISIPPIHFYIYIYIYISNSPSLGYTNIIRFYSLNGKALNWRFRFIGSIPLRDIIYK
jgi:hypothetical protein